VESAPASTILLGELADQFGEWLQREVEAKRLAPATKVYYVDNLQKFLDAVGGRRPASGILPIELERFKSGWHSVQTVRRLYNWGVKMGLLEKNQLAEVERPAAGKRKRILSPIESARLLRGADQHFRRFLLAQRHTIARPQEIRALQWKHFVREPVPHFVLEEFKGKNLRKEDAGPRIIPVDDRLLRLLNRLQLRRNATPQDFVFLNRHGQRWTGNAVRCRMRRLRERVGLVVDERGEEVVAYTLRHSAATRATARGVRDRALADVMGHASTATTARYQHLPVEELSAAIRKTNHRPT
jgi:integrase